MKGLRNTPRVIRWAYFSTSVVTLAKQGFNCFTGTMYKKIIFFGIFPSISANTTLYLKQLGRGNVHGFILLHCNGCFMSRTTAQWAFLQDTVQNKKVTFLSLIMSHIWDRLFAMFYCLLTFIDFTSRAVQQLFL